MRLPYFSAFIDPSTVRRSYYSMCPTCRLLGTELCLCFRAPTSVAASIECGNMLLLFVFFTSN